MCVCPSIHQLHHVVVARFYEQIPLATRMQQMSSKDSKKNALLQDGSSTDYSTSLRRILETIWQCNERGIEHTSYWVGRCCYTGVAQGSHLTPLLPHVFHTHICTL